MTQRVKVAATKPRDWSSVPRSYTVEELSTERFPVILTSVPLHMCPHTYTQQKNKHLFSLSLQRYMHGVGRGSESNSVEPVLSSPPSFMWSREWTQGAALTLPAPLPAELSHRSVFRFINISWNLKSNLEKYLLGARCLDHRHSVRRKQQLLARMCLFKWR